MHKLFATKLKEDVITGKFVNIISLDSVNSTNSYLKENLNAIPDGTVLFTKDQTNGRGKFDRKWYGKAGNSVFCSFLIKNISNPFDAIRFNFKFSLIVKRTLQLYTPSQNLILKWPNDLLVKPDKKICGILSEYKDGCVITGIGINLKPFQMPAAVLYETAFLQDISDKTIDIDDFQLQLITQANKLFTETQSLDAEEIPEMWFNEAEIAGKEITVTNNHLSTKGIIKGITDYGALIIQTSGGETEIINTGDITYHDKL